MRECVICLGVTSEFAAGEVLGSHPATYVRCSSCGAVAAAEPTWLDLAYSSAISSSDLGLLERCRQTADLVVALLRVERRHGGRLLDWAGGYGTLTRMLRDRGIEAFHHDDLCENLFATGFEADLTRPFGFVTAVEVLEHLPDPVAALAPVAALTDRLLITTELLPEPAPLPGQWWYYTPETGQHIVFYTPKALEELARRLGMQVLVVNSNTHLLYRGRLSRRTALALRKPRVLRALGGLRTAVSSDPGLLLSDAGLLREPPA